MPDNVLKIPERLDPGKFINPYITAKGKQRALVALTQLKTLWFNTGSLCNIACQNCYMDSTPTNDSLAYLSATEVENYLLEIEAENLPVEEIAFTGGEPFMNKALISMLGMSLDKGYRVLVLSNAMKPMHQRFDGLLALKANHGDKLTIRVSIDHYSQEKHEAIRGVDTWTPMLKGLKLLAENGFNVTIAGRALWNESDESARASYGTLFKAEDIPVNASNPSSLVLFPEMDDTLDVPEITTQCWDILGVAPEAMMCATSRMVISARVPTTRWSFPVPCCPMTQHSNWAKI
jgi:organic radical activating enzyme